MTFQQLLGTNTRTHTHRHTAWGCTHVQWWSQSCQRIWGLCWHRGGELRTSPSVWQRDCEALYQCKLQKHTHTDTQNNEEKGSCQSTAVIWVKKQLFFLLLIKLSFHFCCVLFLCILSFLLSRPTFLLEQTQWGDNAYSNTGYHRNTISHAHMHIHTCTVYILLFPWLLAFLSSFI